MESSRCLAVTMMRQQQSTLEHWVPSWDQRKWCC